MKITLARHGGIGAGIRRPPQSLDSTTLPAQAAREVARLVTAAKDAPPVEDEKPGRVRDPMSFTITVTEEGGEQIAISQSDAAMSPSFAALLDCLEQHLARK